MVRGRMPGPYFRGARMEDTMDGKVQEILNEVGKVIRGKDEAISLVLTAILARGHILMNIIDNALKYNHPQGFVFIQAKEISCQDGIATCQFVIEDTGIGIREEFKKHIFELFTQENQGARTNYNGVGLGMSIVKELVDQIKGSIEIDSQIGK